MVGWEPFLFNWGALPNNVVKGITETVTISETRARVKAGSRLITSAVNSSDVLEKVRVLIRSLVDTTDIGIRSFTDLSFTDVSYNETLDVIFRLKANIRSFIQSITIAETLARSKGGVVSIGSPLIEPNIIISDAIARLAAKSRHPIDLSFTELSYTSTSFTLPTEGADTIVVSDSVTFFRPTGIAKILTESITIGEAVTKLVARIRTAIQTTTIGETVDTIRAKIRENIEDLGEPEELLESEVISQEITHTKSLEESEAINDDILIQLEKARIIPDTVVVTELLQAFKNGLPLEVESLPDVTNIISGVRERRIRFQEKPPPRFEWQIENFVIAPLRILPFAHDINKVITGIRPNDTIRNTVYPPGLRVGDSDKVLIQTPLVAVTQPHKLKLPLGLTLQPSQVHSNLKLSRSLAQQAIEPRKIINIERRYRALKALQLLHMIESLG
jgi:hypothetical protein